MAGVDTGVQVPCPECGQNVLQKTMIPVAGNGDQAVRYLCIACARNRVVNRPG